jgi:hypothetical protein
MKTPAKSANSDKPPREKTPVLVIDKNGKIVARCETVGDACRKFDLDSRHVSEILRGKRKTNKGYSILTVKAFEERQT